MKIGFTELYEAAVRGGYSQDKPPLEQDDGANITGTVYIKQQPEFWDNLAILANTDPEGLGEMLGVDKGVVASWYSKIKQVAGQAERMKAEKQKNEMLPTGTNMGEEA